MSLSGRPHKLSVRVQEGGGSSPTEDRVESVPVTMADAQVGDAGVSGRVREGVLATSS